jgi:Fe-S cluster assembly ATPase SufC
MVELHKYMHISCTHTIKYVSPDFVHVLYNGRIVKSGPKELALELEERGYDFIKSENVEA